MRILLLLLGRQLQALNYLRNSLSFGNALNDLFALHIMQKNAGAYSCHIWRAWYTGSYTVMAKPIRAPELHYPMIQFLIIIG